jgi:hypothetical protein
MVCVGTHVFGLENLLPVFFCGPVFFVRGGGHGHLQLMFPSRCAPCCRVWRSVGIDGEWPAGAQFGAGIPVGAVQGCHRPRHQAGT